MLQQLPETLISSLPAFRAKYGSIYLLDITSLSETSVTPSCAVIRPMTRREFYGLQNDQQFNPLTIQDKMVRACLLWPTLEDLDDCLGGISDYILRATVKITGFTEENDLIDGVNEGREYSMTLDAAITMFICKAFPKYTPDDIENMTLEKQMRNVAMAEQILGIPLDYDRFLNPEKHEKQDKPLDQDEARERLEMRRRQAQNIPVPDGWESYQAMPPVNDPSAQLGEEGLVTPENLHKKMREVNEMFGGGR